MPRINFPYTTAFTTITAEEIESYLAHHSYLAGGRLDDENIARYEDTTSLRIMPVSTKNVVDYADRTNPVADCMKFFATDNLNTATTSIKEMLFDPLKDMLDANKIYAVATGTVAWAFTRENQPDQARKEKVLTSRGKKLLGGGAGAGAVAGTAAGLTALTLLTGGVGALAGTAIAAGAGAAGAGIGAGIASLFGLTKTVIQRDTNLYRKYITLEKPVNWIPVRSEYKDADIDDVFNIWDDKILYTVEFRTDKMVEASNSDPAPFDIIINGPIVKPGEVVFEVDMIAAALLDKEYVNVELTITCLFEVKP